MCLRNALCGKTFSRMSDWVLIETSVQIVWDYLERSGELGDASTTGRFLADTIAAMVRRGERRRLMLANKAIDAYRRFKGERFIELVS
jgi:hypothetical protein